MAAISRVGESDYELRIYRQGSKEHTALMPYAVNFIGHQGKQYGYLSNAEFAAVANVKPGVALKAH